MSRSFLSNPPRFGWPRVVICLAITALLAAGFWFRWIPGRPVPPEWTRGGASPDNSLTYDTEDDSPATRAADADVLYSSDFLFTMGEGSGLRGFDVIRVWPDGSCEYSYPDLAGFAASALPGPALPAAPAPPATGPTTAPVGPGAQSMPWRRATFTVPPQTVTDLRKLLVDTGYFDLKRSYNGNVEDGTQWFVRARAGGREKGVWCNNHFPADVIKLNDFVRTRIVEPGRPSIANTTRVQLPNNWLPDFGYPITVSGPPAPGALTPDRTTPPASPGQGE
jgi:hypothetical protein